MGRGIAVVFAYAGHEVTIVDFRQRTPEDFQRCRAQALAEVRQTLASLAEFGLFAPTAVDAIAAQVSVVAQMEAEAALSSAAVIFEGVPR